MKFFALFFLSILLFSACSLQKVESQNRSAEKISPTVNKEAAKTPVLVELFTSEG
jgi:hypothetical protein